MFFVLLILNSSVDLGKHSFLNNTFFFSYYTIIFPYNVLLTFVLLYSLFYKPGVIMVPSS